MSQKTETEALSLTLSIVIPVYNEQSYLQNCLDSIARQLVMPDEVIVVDNNSADGSVRIAKQYDFVTVVSEERQGIAHARNKGFDTATGDIIARIDADTILPSTWTNQVREAFDKNPNQAITGSGKFYDMPMVKLLHFLHVLFYFKLNRLVAGQYLIWCSNMAFPARFWPQIKGSLSTDNTIAEDMDLSLVLGKICPITFNSDLLTYNSLRGCRQKTPELWQYIRRWPASFKRHNKKAELMAWGAVGCLVVVFGPAVFVRQTIYYAKRLSMGGLAREMREAEESY